MIEAARRLVDLARRPVSFSGAGLSAESGIPTFRDAQDGLWARYDPVQLASPEGFARDPALVVDWYAHRRRAIAQARPNPAHLALAARRDMVHVTQNVDDLLQRAGADKIVQLHGSIAADRCHGGCGYAVPVDLSDPPGPADCPECGSPLRPAVVWFGESLPSDAWDAAERACTGCDLLLVIGTSAVVHPAAALVGAAKSCGARIIVVNTQESEASALADVEVLGKAGEVVPEMLGEP